MNQKEMEDIIRLEGWTPISRKRRKGNLYLYASHRVGKKMKEVYIAPLSKVEQLTPIQAKQLFQDKIKTA